jgi:uncharacterized membrane protein YgdD (TMEM256/DUF423 family)
MQRVFFAVGSGCALLAVAAGAFGAHALKGRLSADMQAAFEIAVRYQMYHALGLIGVAWALSQWSGQLISVAGWLFLIGIVIFSGSLYALALSGIPWLGAITPIGGVRFIAGWACLVWGTLIRR